MNQITQTSPIVVEGKKVKVCSVCGEAKEYSKFYKDRHSGFRNHQGIDDDTGRSDDCIACRLKQRLAEQEAWLIRKMAK